MHISFPYENFEGLEIPENFSAHLFDLPENGTDLSNADIVRQAMSSSTGCKRLCELSAGKKRVLIVTDDIHRPTPVSEFIDVVLDDLFQAGVKEENIEFMMALGAHRPMTEKEMAQKLGADVVERFNVYNHNWDNEDSLEFIGDTAQGVRSG